MAIQEDGQSFAISTSRGDAVLAQAGQTWAVFTKDNVFGSVVPRDGSPKEALKAAFGPLEGHVIWRTQVATGRSSDKTS